MPSPGQSPDDFVVRPIAFRRYDPDGTVEHTLRIHFPDSGDTIGDLVVRETPNGLQLKILFDPDVQ